ncbi:MAG TPA: HAD domain-containing protein [Pseudolabrys sp.]
MIQFHFADEPIAGRSRFHAKRRPNEGYFSRHRRGPQWLQNAQSTGPALYRGQKASAHIQEAGVPDPCKGRSHSDWRHDPAGLFSARYWRIRYADVVPDLPKRSRGDEICAWLRKHPEVKRYAVIDDDDDQLDDLPLFQPSSSIGLTQKIANGVSRYLQGKTDRDMRAGPITRTLENLRTALKRVV